MRTESEIRDKLKEYEENIKFLETSLKDNEITEELGITWNKIITEIAKDLNVDDAVELDAIFRNIFDENYEMARDILDDFIKEYGVDSND